MRSFRLVFVACILTICLFYIHTGCSSSKDKKTGTGTGTGTGSGTGTTTDFDSIRLHTLVVLGPSPGMTLACAFTVWDNCACYYIDGPSRHTDVITTGELSNLSVLINDVDFSGLQDSYTTDGDNSCTYTVTLTYMSIDETVIILDNASGVPAELEALRSSLEALRNKYDGYGP